MARAAHEVVADLTYAFPDYLARLDPDSRRNTIRLYLRELEDIPAETLEAAVSEVIRTSDHFPRVRAVREAAARILLQLPSESEALSQIESRMRWSRESEGERGDAPAVSPIVLKALDHVGGFHAFRSSDEPGVVRGQFLRLFKGMRDDAIRDVNVVAALPPGPALRALEA